MKILITGASGFIGRAVVAQLKDHKGIELIALLRGSRPASDFRVVYYEDLDKIPSMIHELRPDLLIHLAAHYSLVDTIETDITLIESNIGLTTAVMRGMSELGVGRVLLIGTMWQSLGLNSNCSHPNFYALTKTVASEIAKYYCDKSELELFEVLLSDTFGPEDSRKKIVDLLIESCLSKKIVDLTPGYQEICLMPVENVAINLIKGIVFNKSLEPGQYIMPGYIITIKSLAGKIAKITRSHGFHNFGAKPYRPFTELKFSYPATNVLDNFGELTLDEALTKYIEHKVKI